MSVGSGDGARNYRLDVTISEATPDSYPEYLEMFEGGLDIAVHIGDDHNGDWVDIAQADSVFDALTQDLGSRRPWDLRRPRPRIGSLHPSARCEWRDGRRLGLPLPRRHGRRRASRRPDPCLRAERVLRRRGHLLRSRRPHADLLGRGGPLRPSRCRPGFRVPNLELPDQYQIFVFAGCETYTGYSESLFAHEGKTSERRRHHHGELLHQPSPTATITLITGLVDDAQGTWWPHSWGSLLENMNEADAGHRWTAMYGVHGLGDNPQISPLGRSRSSAKPARSTPTAPASTTAATSWTERSSVAWPVQTMRAAPIGSHCMMVDIGLDDPHYQCIMQ